MSRCPEKIFSWVQKCSLDLESRAGHARDHCRNTITHSARIHLHPFISEAINTLASTVFVLMRPIGFGPMSINKGPKRRTDGQASLHATFLVLRAD